MKKEYLFNSKNDPVPAFRSDLEIITVKENGTAYFHFHDTRGYATSGVALNQQVGPLLSLFDGNRSIADLKPHLGSGADTDQLLKFVRFLDGNGLLNSRAFREYAEKVEQSYEQSAVHTSVTSGDSYPSDPDELIALLDEAFGKYRQEDPAKGDPQLLRGLYAPHIDPRVSLQSYVNAFAPVEGIKPDRIVILATSHYAGLYPGTYENKPFVLVNKDFELPLGTVQADRESITRFTENEGLPGLTLRDRAHRMEHSIELHLLFLRYLWQHDFKVIPFLINNLDDLYYMSGGYTGQQLDLFSRLLNRQFADDSNTFFLISGDLSHIGKKFGDRQSAAAMFDEVEKFDREFLRRASRNRREGLLQLMRQDMDPYRICGFPPLYTFLRSMPGVKGTVTGYKLWDESERESAVSFGSILYRVTR